MIVIPAIDIHEDRCVRIAEGRAQPEAVYADDPLAVAQRWAHQGARWLHVIDYDGLAAGRPSQLEVIAAIATIGVPVQAEGGFRTMEAIEAGFASGVARVLVDAAALGVARAASRRFPDRVAALLTVRSGRSGTHLEGKRASPDPIGSARALVAGGIRRIVYTDLARDGSLAGPDCPALEAFVRAVGVPVIAAGGVASPDDLVALERIGIEGAVVGRALYEGRLELRSMTDWQKSKSPRRLGHR